MSGQPCVPLAVLGLLWLALMARAIDFDDQPTIEAHEVDDESPQRDLPAKLRALAPAIANGPPDDRLGLDRVGALPAGQTKEDGAGGFGGHQGMLERRANFRKQAVALRATPPHLSRCA